MRADHASQIRRYRRLSLFRPFARRDPQKPSATVATDDVLRFGFDRFLGSTAAATHQ